MGNIGSGGGRWRNHNSIHHHHHHHPPPPPPHQPPTAQPPTAQPPEAAANRYVFAAATPYPHQYPGANSPPQQYYQYAGYYHSSPPPAMPVPLRAPFDHHHRVPEPHGYPYSHMPPPPVPTPYVEHQKAVTIRNDVNLKKETLRMVPDEENPGKFLVAFTFDATITGSICCHRYHCHHCHHSIGTTTTTIEAFSVKIESVMEHVSDKFDNILHTLST